MEFGVQLGNMEPAQYRANAQAAEALGYELIVFPDHLVNEGPERQYDPKSPAYDHIAMAAALIEATKKIRVGHLVLCNLFRHPAITAQSLMTLDRLSGGRRRRGSRHRMDRDGIQDERDCVPANHRAAADARRSDDLHPVAVEERAHDFRR